MATRFKGSADMTAHVLLVLVGWMAFIVLLMHMTMLVRRLLIEGVRGNKALVFGVALWAALAGIYMLYLLLHVYTGAAALWAGANLSLALGASQHLRTLGRKLLSWVVLLALAAGVICNVSAWLPTAVAPQGDAQELLALDITLLVSFVMLLAGLIMMMLRSKTKPQAGTTEIT